MRFKLSRAIPAVLGLALVGCSSPTFYRVTDKTSDEVYYTKEKDLSRQHGGEMRLIDARTGRTVTLTSSKVEEISKQEFSEQIDY